MSSQVLLRELIASIPVPGAPIRLSGEGAAIGLAFLEASLSLTHVKRLTETITVHERARAEKRTEVDVNLSLLGRDQRVASGMLAEMVRPASAVDDVLGEHRARARSSELWVPAARVPRSTGLPVPVQDGYGHRLPTLTQFETSRLLTSGLYRLFRGILESHEDARDVDGDLGRFLHRFHEPRWLVQQALVTLLAERVSPLGNASAAPVEGTVRGHTREHRIVALEILDRYGEMLEDYFELLDIATEDHLLVVSLDGSRDEHVISYESHLSDDRAPRGHRDLGRLLRIARDGYHVQYRTTIPSSLRAYHLVVRSAEEVRVHQMHMSTDADRGVVNQLSDDLRTLASQVEAHRAPRPPATSSVSPKILDLETQVVLQRLADVLRRRQWDAGRAGLAMQGADFDASLALAAAATAGEAVVGKGGKLDHSLLAHPAVTGDRLRNAAREVGQREIDRDYRAEKETTDHESHAFWGRASAGRAERQLTIRAGFVLREASADGFRSVTAYCAGVSLIAYVMGCLLTDGLWPFTAAAAAALVEVRDADAVVAVLLLVPTFLYTRLVLPRPGSVAGVLRLVPRAAAQGSILLIAALCATIAAQADGTVIATMVGVATFVPLTVVIVLQALRLGRRRRPLDDLARLEAPVWLLPAGHARRRRHVDLVIGDDGGVPSTDRPVGRAS